MGLVALDQQCIIFAVCHHVEQALPVCRFARQHHIARDRVAADKNLRHVDTKLQRQAHSLTATCGEYFCGLVHFELLCYKV
jgi:hypothetical protein